VSYVSEYLEDRLCKEKDHEVQHACLKDRKRIMERSSDQTFTLAWLHHYGRSHALYLNVDHCAYRAGFSFLASPFFNLKGSIIMFPDLN